MTRAKDISKIVSDANFAGTLDVGGVLTGTSLDISGDIDVDGTTNLDVVDVDGAVNFAVDVTFADGADIITATAGTSNFRAGVNAGNSIVSGGNYNVVVGDEAGTAITTGDNNTALGFEAGKTINTASLNTLIGSFSGRLIDTGIENLALGYNALGADVKGNASIAIGSKALQAQSFSGATDVYNTAVGHNAGKTISTGLNNTLIGAVSGDALSDADNNTAVGRGALGADTKGNNTTAIGFGALSSQNFTSITDTHNTAVGFNAGVAISSGIGNTILGSSAGSVLTTGLRNTLLGYNAGLALATSNSDNVFVGQGSGSAITSGDANVIIGRYNGNVGGLDIRTSSNNIVLSDGDGNPRIVVNSSGRVKIGGSDQDGHLHLFGNFASGRSAVFHNDGNNSNRYGLMSLSGSDDASGTNYAFDIADGNGSLQGSITFTSGTVTYGAFTAYHPCIIPNADNDPNSETNAYPYGTLLEITSLSYTQKNGADTERGIRYNVQKSSSAKSKAVLGAYGSSMNGGPNDNTNMHQALILGDGHILCNNENGNIAVGDYICTSSVSGEGMKATSICTTIGIAREAITFSNSTAVLVAVEYGYRQFVPEDLEARITALEGA